MIYLCLSIHIGHIYVCIYIHTLLFLVYDTLRSPKYYRLCPKYLSICTVFTVNGSNWKITKLWNSYFYLWVLLSFLMWIQWTIKCQDICILLISVILQVASCAFIQFFSVHATNVNEYLYEKLRQSKIEFIKIHIQETSPGKFM